MTHPARDNPPPPPPPPGQPWQSPYEPPTLGYRAPGAQPRSQWWTDEDAYAGCMIYGLLGLTVLGAIAGGVWWVVSSLVGA